MICPLCNTETDGSCQKCVDYYNSLDDIIEVIE